MRDRLHPLLQVTIVATGRILRTVIRLQPMLSCTPAAPTAK
ncbi:hypothetical protein [Mesorhizobium sp. M0053]